MRHQFLDGPLEGKVFLVSELYADEKLKLSIPWEEYVSVKQEHSADGVADIISWTYRGENPTADPVNTPIVVPEPQDTEGAVEDEAEWSLASTTESPRSTTTSETGSPVSSQLSDAQTSPSALASRRKAAKISIGEMTTKINGKSSTVWRIERGRGSAEEVARFVAVLEAAGA